MTEAAPLSPSPLAVYIHWPYCARICPYCDFNVVRARGRADEEMALHHAIFQDLARQAARLGPRRLTSIFLGGGTPSLMEPEAAGALIEACRSFWTPDGDLEVTLEANPTDAEADRFAAFAAAGVNRLSLGVQSFDDAALAFLGRNHGAEEARRAIALAGRTFERLSIDLIYARPGQSLDQWRGELEEAVASGAEHISPYQLTIEEGTAFGRRAGRGETMSPPEDTAADLYELTQAVLSAAGFEAYEVSNHARGEAARSRHNLAYWRGWDYLGAGPGAHGRLTLGGVRHATEAPAKIADYVLGGGSDEALSPEDTALERLLMGIRSIEGVRLKELAALHLPSEKLRALEGDGLISLAGDALTATARGRPLLDAVTRTLTGA
ncbi:MAG: radical SAM family heme chaperone HemW [Caulobacteraceae bacterium]